MTLLAAAGGWALTQGRPAPGDPFPSLEMLHGLRVSAAQAREILGARGAGLERFSCLKVFPLSLTLRLTPAEARGIQDGDDPLGVRMLEQGELA